MFSKSPKHRISKQNCNKLIAELKAIGEKNIDSYLRKAFSNCKQCDTTQ